MAIFTVLPKSHPSPPLLARYKSFRLTSLLLSPSSFAATHAAESALPEETWISRLTNPSSTTIIATNPSIATPIATNPTNKTTEDGDDPWLASLVISGPLNRTALAEKLYLPEPPAVLVAARQYVLGGMYVIPSARGNGLAAEMIDFAKRYVVARDGEAAQMSLVLDYDNEPAMKTYRRCGFELVHRYWFDDPRPGRSPRTEAAVMVVSLGKM